MTIDWWTLGLQTVNFVVLIWILAHFLFRPVIRIIAERQAAAHSALDEAEAMRDQARSAREAADAEMADIAARRTALIAMAGEDAEAEKRRLLDAARADVEKLRTAAQAELEQMRTTEERALADQASLLATDIVERLLARLPDSARIDGFIDGLAKAVADLPDATRAGIGAQGPVQVRAARAPTAQERTRLTKKLRDVLNRAIDIEIKADPTLLAGLELDAQHAIVSNHFRADLDRIAESLTSDG